MFVSQLYVLWDVGFIFSVITYKKCPEQQGMIILGSKKPGLVKTVNMSGYYYFFLLLSCLKATEL